MQQASSQDSQQKTMLARKYGNRDAFLTKYNPSFQMQICSNAQVCFFGDYPTLAALRQSYGENAPKMWLIPQLVNLSEYCGVKDKLEGTPLEETAFVIATEYYYLKVSEMMLFFYRFKTGRYGRFYGNVDPLVIATALREFVKERNAEYDRKEKEERERQAEISSKNAITWEEYCRLNDIKDKDRPF